jgi:glycine cleavage system H lipoate-binding protein
VIEGIRLPSGLWYAANHLWLDLAEDGWCHAGIDGLLAKLLGRVEQVTALVSGDTMRPAAVLRAHRLDWHVAFPNPIPEPAGNPQLRAHPDRLIADPYGDGWLFAGRVNPPDTTVAAGLIAGEQAVEWMRSEVGRISRRLRGRAFEHGLLDRLDRDEALSIFQDFCQ